MTVGLSLGERRWRLIRRGVVVDPVLTWFASTGADGLYLRYDSDESLYQDAALTQLAPISAPVGGWTDLSGNGYAATMPTAARKPLRTAGGVKYDAVDDYLDAGQILKFGTESFMVAAVVDAPDTGTTQTVVSCMYMPSYSRDSGYIMYLQPPGNLGFRVGSADYKPVFAAQPAGGVFGKHLFLVIVDREADQIRFRADGQAIPGATADITTLGDITGSESLWLGSARGVSDLFGGTQQAIVIAGGTDYSIIEQSLLELLP